MTRTSTRSTSTTNPWRGSRRPLHLRNRLDGLRDTARRIRSPGQRAWAARKGGALLAADVNGLWVTHNSLTPQHITVIGHSYGSTTVATHLPTTTCVPPMRSCSVVLERIWAHGAADFHLDGGHVYVARPRLTRSPGSVSPAGCRSNGFRAGSGNPAFISRLMPVWGGIRGRRLRLDPLPC